MCDNYWSQSRPLGEGARRALRRLTVGGAAKRYYHGEAAEKSNPNLSREHDLVVPKRLDELRMLGGDGKEGNVKGDDERILLSQGTSGRKVDKGTAMFSPTTDQGSYQKSKKSTLIDESKLTLWSDMHGPADSNNNSLQAQTTSSDRSDLVLVPVMSENLSTSDPRDTVLDSDRFSMDELWPAIPQDSLVHEDSGWEEPSLEGSSILNTLPAVQDALNEGKLSREIHILGMGVIGKFIAHGLASLPNPPPITLLMQRPLLMQQWHDEGAAITVLKGGRLYTQRGFNIESAANFQRQQPNQRFAGFGPNMEHSVEPPNTVIQTLIVTTASKVTVPALMAVRHRLRPSSTICIIQDGLGLIEDLNTIVFPDPQRRPAYVLGSMTGPQRLNTGDRTFMIIQRGDVSIACSKLPRKYVTLATESEPSVTRLDFSWSLPTAYLVSSLARVSNFRTKTMGHKSFYKAQLYRLVVHSVIGPVSVLHDCSNSQLLTSYNARRTMRSVLTELSLIIRSLPEVQSLPNIERDFSVRKLEAVVRGTLIKTADLFSTMLQNVNAGRRTDIDYYNGYLITRAAEMGIDCPRNEMLVNVVKAKQMIKSRVAEAQVPFVNE